ncbi:unnamed protein product [Mytilus coruscus]|uniref:ANK n=1 Tax=Mytilus coruscus TaxID=42192 RepID=A0A6J8A7V2_MYTCO|nr:unnamed protein product [Mytilus coruscus]
MTTFDRNWILGKDYIFIPSVKSFFPLAILGGNLDIVKELICSGADVNCFSEFWETPLYIAVKSGRDDMVSLLVKNGATVNLRGWFIMNVPILVTSNKQELTCLILEYDLNQTELHIAVRHNDLENLKSNILSENVDSKTKSGWTVLHYAVLLNNLEAVKVLFHEEFHKNDDSYVDITHADSRELLYRAPTPKVNIGDNNGLTAVHLAVVNNNIEILSFLLLKKAEVKVSDVLDRTPLHYITSDRATKLLLTHSSQNQCLRTNRTTEEETEYKKTPITALRTMCLNIILSTFFRHIWRDFVNAPDSKGNTPLHSVINRCILKEESSKCVEILLENGANPYLLNDNATSAFKLNILNKSSVDIDIWINNRAKLEQTIKITCSVFAAFMLFLVVVTYLIFFETMYVSIEIGEKSKTAVFCFGPIAESGNITVVQENLVSFRVLEYRDMSNITGDSPFH